MFTPDQVNKRSLAVKRDLDSAARSKAAKTMLDKAAAEKRARPMSEDFEPIADMITLVANDQHGEATGIINDLLSARVLDALQDHKQTIAQTLFAPSADALSEEMEQLDELSKGTLQDYVKRASTQVVKGKVPAQGKKGPKVGRILGKTYSRLEKIGLAQRKINALSEETE